MSLLSAFNNLLEQFIQEMIKTFPDLEELRTIQTLVSLMRRMNPRMILMNFLDVAGRYYEEILTKDSKFFENLENWKRDPRFQQEAAAGEYGGEDEIFQKLVVFKSVWCDLTETNRATIWNYFQQLLVIAAKGNNNPLMEERCLAILNRALEVNGKR